MNVPSDERTLLTLAVGVLFFCILSVILFVSGLNQVFFYVSAVIAIILGFYFSYTLSRKEKESDQPSGSRKGR